MSDQYIGDREPHNSERIMKSISEIGNDTLGFNMIGEDKTSRLIGLIVDEEAKRTRIMFEYRTRIWELEEAIERLSSELRAWELSALRAGEGAVRISHERARQQIEEGYGADHDDAKVSGTLVQAAIAFALGDPTDFPWADRFWKPSDDHVRNLEKAGGLIAAEIDRILRARREQMGKKPEQPEFDSRRNIVNVQERPFA